MKKILAILSSVLLLACGKNEKNAYTVTDLSGEYRLSYVGSDSRCKKNNLQEYSNGSYAVITEPVAGKPNNYLLQNSNGNPLFRMQFYQGTTLTNNQGTDTILIFQGVDAQTYTPSDYSSTDSLILAAPDAEIRSVFAHQQYLLIQISKRLTSDSTTLYFKLIR